MDPKVSIVVPVYNASNYLYQCLDSLIEQSYQNLEIILVDDASQDASPAICDQYAIRDSRIIVVHKQNKGASFARKTGIDLSTGKYVMFVDSDDWIEADTVSQLVLSAEMNNADCVLFSYVKEFKDHTEEVYLFNNTCYFHHDDAEKHIHKQLIGPDDIGLGIPSRFNLLSPMWGKLYRADVVKKGFVVSEREIGGTGEDTLFNIYALEGCASIGYIHKCLYHYRKYNNHTLTTSYKSNLMQSLSVFYNYIENYIISRKITEYYSLLQNRMSCSLISLFLNEAYSPSNFVIKQRNVNTILKNPNYVHALKHLNIKKCKIHWKLFFGLCKYQQSFLITIFIMAFRLWKIRY